MAYVAFQICGLGVYIIEEEQEKCRIKTFAHKWKEELSFLIRTV